MDSLMQDLEALRLSTLQSSRLDSNELFKQLRSKLITFYKKLERFKEEESI
jgi:hypothetical protein